MFLPLKTEAHDGRIRMGSVGILVLCLLVHILVSWDQGKRAGRMLDLLRDAEHHATDGKFDDLLDQAGGRGVFEDEASRAGRKDRAEKARQAVQEEHKQSLMYRLALVNGDFNPVNLITHQFTHGDWLHLIFNLWFFYIVGVTMEKYWGLGRFLGLYLGCGVLGALGFIFLSGAKSAGVPLVGASAAIAGMMGAFARTHGDAKVSILWIWGIRFRTFAVPAKWYLGFWAVGQVVDAVLHSGQQGGVAFSAHVVGFVAGLAAAGVVRGDSFYEKAYTPEITSEDVERLSGPGKLEVPKPAGTPSYHQDGQDGTQVTTALNRGLHALEHGDAKGAGAELFQAMDKVLSIPALPESLIRDTVLRVLSASPGADLPPGALYTWARRLEQKDWWEWAIAYYDAAAADFSQGTSTHSRNSSLLRAAGLRLDHNRERELAVTSLRRMREQDPEGPFAAEAGTRLAAAGIRTGV